MTVFNLLNRQVSRTFMSFSSTSKAGTDVMNLVDLLTRSEKEGGAWLLEREEEEEHLEGES